MHVTKIIEGTGPTQLVLTKLTHPGKALTSPLPSAFAPFVLAATARVDVISAHANTVYYVRLEDQKLVHQPRFFPCREPNLIREVSVLKEQTGLDGQMLGTDRRPKYVLGPYSPNALSHRTPNLRSVSELSQSRGFPRSTLQPDSRRHHHAARALLWPKAQRLRIGAERDELCLPRSATLRILHDNRMRENPSG